MVKLRLRRVGNRNRPVYRVVVADQRLPRDGRFIEEIGTSRRVGSYINSISYCEVRVRGLVGYDVALTWRRSPVRIRADPPTIFLLSIYDILHCHVIRPHLF